MSFKDTLKKLKEKAEEKKRIKYQQKQEKYNNKLRDELQKQQFLTKKSKIQLNTFTKRMVAGIIIISIIDIQISYVLAFLDKGEAMQDLSVHMCTTILGVAFVYMIRAYFDSKAEHNNLDNKIKDSIIENLSGKINNIFTAAGLEPGDTESFLRDEDESSGYHINHPEPEPANDDSKGG